jgi:hypothetical protein
MRKEWILTDEEKVNKKRRIEENRLLREPDTDNFIVSRKSTRKNDLDLQKVLFNKDEKPALNSTISSQSSDIITNVVMAYNDSIKLELTGYGWSYPLARKITALCQIINARNTTALRLINFYKRLHDFNLLNEPDRVNLIKNNLSYVFFFHASLKYVFFSKPKRNSFTISILFSSIDMIQSMMSIMKKIRMINPYTVPIFVKHMVMITISD